MTVYYALAGSDEVLALRHPELPAVPTPQLLLTLGFYVALLMLVGLWLLPLIRRLRRLARASEAFGQGDLEARVPTRKGSDLHAVECAFNAMAARIGRLIDDNRLLARGVAHDLKTPLARLRFGIDSLEELDTPANAPERHRDHLHRLQADLDAMEGSLDAMLGYARFELRGAGEPHRRVDLAALVADRVAACGVRPDIAFAPGDAARQVRGGRSRAGHPRRQPAAERVPVRSRTCVRDARRQSRAGRDAERRGRWRGHPAGTARGGAGAVRARRPG